MARRPAGIEGSKGLQRYKEGIARVPPTGTVPEPPASDYQKSQPNYGRGLFGEDRYGLFGDRVPEGPQTTDWQYPDSSRVKAFMYDYNSHNLYVTWQNGKTPWIYEGVSTTIYEVFANAPSKGKYINSTLNFTNHHRISTMAESDMFTGV